MLYTVTQMMKRLLFSLLLLVLGIGIGLGLSQVTSLFFSESGELLVPTIIQSQPKTEPPLSKFAITRLHELPLTPAKISLVEEVETTSTTTNYLFRWTSRGKVMTGSVIIPKKIPTTNPPTIIMLRGYVPPDLYETGVGTKNAAATLARNGYITVAPDFFGYGGSDPEPIDTWQARFEKPLIVMELIQSLQTEGIAQQDATLPPITTEAIGIWAHSNGGQIALTTLEAYKIAIPTTLWAPVTAPFPYAIQFFSDELEDEGKTQRKWISLFEETYDAFDFSLTKHLSLLSGPLQIHHGELDDAAPIAWSDEFVEKTKKINETIEVTYFRYPGTDHNLQPSWNIAITRDLTFFREHLVPQQ